MILRNPLTSPVRGARQNGRAPSRAFGRAQKAIYAGSIRIPQDAGYRGYAEDIQLEQQLIRKLLYSPTGLSTFFLEFVQNWFDFSKKPSTLVCIENVGFCDAKSSSQHCIYVERCRPCRPLVSRSFYLNRAIRTFPVGAFAGLKNLIDM